MGKVGVVDLGSGYFKAVIADEQANVEAAYELRSRGVERGAVVKSSLARKLLKDVIVGAEASVNGSKPDGYHVLLSHPSLKSQNVRVSLDFQDEMREITEAEIEELVKKAKASADEVGYEIVHVVPRYFLLDGERYFEPYGLVASKFEGEFHVVKLPVSVTRNVSRLLTGIGYKAYGVYFPALMAGKAVEEGDEVDYNTLLIDLGHTTTGFVFYEKGAPLVSGVVPAGGKDLVQAVAKTFRIPAKEAESLVQDFGTVLPYSVEETEEVSVKVREGREVSLKLRDLAFVLEKELIALLEEVLLRLHKSGVNVDEELDRVVLVGGLTQLRGVKELLEEALEREVVLGIPYAADQFSGKVHNPMFAPAVGTIFYLQDLSWKVEDGLGDLFGLPETEAEPPLEPLPPAEGAPEEPKKKGLFGRIIGFFKGIFSED
ncbi:MAG: hypothetical protein GXO08_01655 [Aquificae bacterium]|nr:hypothetical protein [Aquificota bacterium]